MWGEESWRIERVVAILCVSSFLVKKSLQLKSITKENQELKTQSNLRS